MCSKAVCFLFVAFFVGLTSAIPVLPLSAAIGEKLSDTGRTFIVQVQEPAAATQPQQQQQLVAQPEQKREFPWPYPPVFEPYLPQEAKQRLRSIYADPSLSSDERVQQIDGVFDELPQRVVEVLPLPVEYERLPADVYRRIVYIHTAPGFKWAERQQLIRDIVESLPDEQKHLMQTPRFGGPPPMFERVLSPTVYKQLLMVHHNPRLSKEEKATMITRIMRQVPSEQINQLPLPAGMEQLPFEVQQRLRSLVYDYSVEQPVRAQRVRQFVQQLPDEIRPPLRR